MAKLLRIFISSPGDVAPERRRAALVIEKLAKDYARFFEIKPYLWETEPMLASGHFQDAIVPPGETDVVVLILWARLGTPLPERTQARDYRGLDGRVPVTGTEWEFETALAAHRQRGAPDLLAYKKKAPPKAEYRSDADLEELRRQLQRLDGFWSRYFVDQGEFRIAFGEFDDLDGFEGRIESDLRQLIERHIAALQGGAETVAAPTWLKGSPFRGLETYRFEHSPIFFGRGEATKAAVEHLVENAEAGRPFLLVLGASGAGKSSLAQAGVVPALELRGVATAVGGWRRAIMRPGGHRTGPFAALAASLAEDDALPELLKGQDIAAFARHLEAAAAEPGFPIVAALAVRELAARQQGDLLPFEEIRLILVVDQLEELFTLTEATADQRKAFVLCLKGLMDSGRVFVIATMRSDYWHRAAEAPQLVALAEGRGRLDLLPPTQAEITEMIRRPAEVAGLSFETDPRTEIRLDAALAEEAAREPGALPLLSFLLDALYARDVQENHGSTLRYASMRALGGLKGAIANRAEAVFAGLPAEVQAALPNVLRMLVTVSRPGAEASARIAPMTRFAEASPERRLVEALLDPQVRLLVAEGDGEGARVQLAHEALITHWERARRQIAQDRDDLRVRAVVEEAMIEWRNANAGAKRGYLLRDPQLANAVDLTNRWRGQLDEATLGFIQASRRRARFVQRLTMAAAIVFSLVVVVAGGAIYLDRQAERTARAENVRAQNEEAQKFVTQSRFLVALAGKIAEQGYAATAAALSLEGLPDPSHGIKRPYLIEAERSLFASLQPMRERATLRGHTWTITNAVFSPDGRSLLTSSWDHSIRVWDVATWKERLKLDDNAGAVTVATFSPDGRFILAAPNDGTARIFDAVTGAVVHRLVGPHEELWDARYAPDGARVLTASGDKAARLWDPRTGQLVAVLSGHTDAVTLGAFSPDSAMVVTVGAEPMIKAWRASDGRFLFDIAGSAAKITSAAFSPDGRILASAGEDGIISLWDAATGRPVRTLAGPKTQADNLVFSPDGRKLAASYGDNTVRIWQLASSQEILELKGHTEFIWRLAFSPDGKLVATASEDKTARLWDAETGREIAVLRGHGSGVRKASFSPDGRWLATVSGKAHQTIEADPDYTARIWDVASTLEVARIAAPKRILEPAGISPDGKLVLIRDGDSSERSLSVSAHLWDGRTDEELRDLRIEGRSIESVAVSSDGSRVVTVDRSAEASLWNAATAGLVATVKSSPDNFIVEAAFSPDGTMFATSEGPSASKPGKHQISLWRASDGARVGALAGTESDIAGLAFSVDGKRLLGRLTVYGTEHGFAVWRLDAAMAADDEPVQALAIVKDKDISAAIFADRGASVLTIDENGRVRAWDSDSGKQTAAWEVAEEFGAKSFPSPDGRAIVMPTTVGEAQMLRVVDRDLHREATIPADSGGSVDGVIFAPAGDRFATYSSDGKIRVRDARDGALIASIETTTAAPRVLQFSNGGNLLAIGAGDGAVELWDVGANAPPRRLTGHTDAVTCIAFSRDGERIATGSADNSARVWNVASGAMVGVMPGFDRSIASVAFVDAGRRLLALDSGAPVTASDAALVTDAESGKVTSRIVLPRPADGGATAIDSMAFSQPGDRIFVRASSGPARVFEARSGKLLMVQPPSAEISLNNSPDDLFFSNPTMSPSGRLLAWRADTMSDSAPKISQFQIAEVATGKTVKTIAFEGGSPEDPNDFSFSPDDKSLIMGARIWSVETGEEWRGRPDGEKPALKYSPDGRLLAVLSKAAAVRDPLEDAAIVSDARSGRTSVTLRGHAEPIGAIAIAPDGKLIATGSGDATIRFWDAASGRQTGMIDLKGPTDDAVLDVNPALMEFSPDGHRLVVADRGGALRVWDVASRSALVSLPGVEDPLRIAFSPDGRFLAATSRMGDRGLRLWEAATFKEIAVPDWKANVYGNPIAFSPDGRRLVSAPEGGQAYVLDTATGKVVATLRGHNFRVTAAAYSPDGRRIATVSNDAKLRLWDAETLAETDIPTGHESAINALAFSPDGRTIALGSGDKTISLWDVAQGALLRRLSGHEGEVESVAFVEDGAGLVSVGADRTLRSWRVDTGDETGNILHPGGIAAYAIADHFLVSAGAQPPQTEERFQLELWDAAGRRKLDLAYEQRGAFDIVFSPDGRFVLTLPDSGAKDSAPTLLNVAAAQTIGALTLENKQIGRSAVFAPDGETLATYGSGDDVYVWRTGDGKLTGALEGVHAENMLAQIFSGVSIDHVDIASGGNRILTHSTNGVVRQWDGASLRLLAEIKLDDAVKFDAALDGRRLVTANDDGSVHILKMTGTTQELVDWACRLLPAPLTKTDREQYALDPEPDHYPCGRKP